MHRAEALLAGWIALWVSLSGCAGPTSPPAVAPAGMGAPTTAPSPAEAPAPEAAGPTGRELPKLTDTSTLSDYLAYAALNNPGLEAAFDGWKAAVERVPQVRALPDPRFTYRYYIRSVETRVGPQREAFGLAQTLPWFGKLELQGSVAMAAAEAQRRQYEARKLALFYQVKDAYYEYYYLARSVATMRESIQLLQNIERVVRTRYQAAAASHPDLIRLQVELGKLDDRLRTLVDLRSPIVARLNAAMDRPADAPLPWPGAIVEPKVAVTDREVLGWLEQSSPELQALDQEVARSKSLIELARKDYFPDVTVGVDYIDTATSSARMTTEDNGKDAVMAMVSINVPIWWDKLAAGVREARFRHSAAVHQKRQKVNSLGAELKLVLYRFRDADRRIGLYRDTLLPKARQGLKATQTAFQAGKASYNDFVDAQRILLDFELAYERALSNKAQRLAEMEMRVGRQIAPAGGTDSADPDVQKGDTAGRDEQRAAP